ncbi:glycosyl transferase [Streptomyces humidus]|uniref:Glycosyl transferase n=1 Tax=Streptomyces humidus TaxID=52259 RepID=A0A918L5W1_9ACTN|nr:nucleotide disphospho-sugar-binding domain-containing protein [Streptomyces humidus]GGS05664.1 glycosyl transferase [Streptomyces humidus]
MRVLAISSPSATHFMPAVPLMWALRSAGHDVMFLGQPDVVGMARGAGLPTVCEGALFDVDELFLGLPEGKRPIDIGLAQLPRGGWTAAALAWVFHAKYLLDPYLDFARRWKPDLIVTDPLEYAGLIVGGVLGVPTVHHRWGPEPVSSAGLALARTLLHGRAVRHGLAGLPDPALLLDPFPAELGLPDEPAGRPIRPVAYNGGGSVPSWLWQAEGDRRRVCVSFGRSILPLNGLSLIRHVVDAFDGLDGVEALVTLEREHRPALGPVPDQVRLVDPLPIREVLEISDAVVHHGGGGTTLTAVLAARPHLLLPQIMDQHVRCERLEEAGVAVRLGDAGSQNDPGVIRDALTTLLDKPGYRQAAVALRERALELPSPAEVARDLEELAAR